MKPFTLTALGKAPALVTSLGIFEWQNRSVLMLANRRQTNNSYRQRARMLHLETGQAPSQADTGISAAPSPGKGCVPASKVRPWYCWTPASHKANNCSRVSSFV